VDDLATHLPHKFGNKKITDGIHENQLVFVNFVDIQKIWRILPTK
jgi:hypothetical protein